MNKEYEALLEENDKLKRQVAQLRSDRTAFAEETQKYRDSWLKDQKKISRFKNFLGSASAVIVEADTLLKNNGITSSNLEVALKKLDALFEEDSNQKPSAD